MKILLATLQVSRSGSKGHLHPALRLAGALLERGHEVALLALPNPLSDVEHQQALGLGLTVLPTPANPVARTAAELTALAGSGDTVHLAYRAFLIEPLPYQLGAVEQLVDDYAPEAVVSDTLAYAAALTARKRGIVDVGFCAGLKLIAPPELTRVYRQSHQRLQAELESYPQARFRNLELLSNRAQFVFALPELVECFAQRPEGTVVPGPLPYPARPRDPQDYVVLCFGSAMEPARFPHLVEAATLATARRGLRLLVASREWVGKDHVTVEPYLDFTGLLPGARAVIHHGGASCFGETLAAAAPQLLIPLVNDQPIQAEVLRRSGAGLTLAPSVVDDSSLLNALDTLLDESHPLHQRRRQIAEGFAQLNGAAVAARQIECYR